MRFALFLASIKLLDATITEPPKNNSLPNMALEPGINLVFLSLEWIS